MSEKEFKVGDRVRVIDAPCPEWMQNMPALPDTIFKVEDTQNDKLILSMECSDARFIVDAEHFELVETPEQNKNMGDLSSEPIREAESYLVNQAFGDSYIRATSKCFDIKGEIKDYDPKTAFLRDLSELLRKYDAKINFGFSVEERTCGVLFDIKDERIFYPFKVDEMNDTPDAIWRLPGSNYPLTADNVLNYYK